MTPRAPDTVLCATRGGPGSRACQVQAIEEARRRGARLVFVHVVDDAWAEEIDEPSRAAIREELGWLGWALLQIAARRASESGARAELMLRVGDTWDEVLCAAREVDATLLMIGAPIALPETAGALSARLAEELEHSTAVEVVDETGVTVASRR